MVLYYQVATSSRRDRIGRGHMRHRFVFAVRANASPRPTASRLPSFSSRASAMRSRVRGLAQEIDVEIGGHRQRHRTDRGEHRDIHGEVGKRHHASGRKSCRPAAAMRSRKACRTRQPPSHSASIDRPLSGLKDLRKLGAEKTLELVDRHHDRHLPPLPCGARPNAEQPRALVSRIPKFASLCGALACELRNQRDTSNL